MRKESKPTAELQLVLFDLASAHYAVSSQCVREIIRMQSITRVPGALEFVQGVTNLRGKVVPAIDLRKRLARAWFSTPFWAPPTRKWSASGSWATMIDALATLAFDYPPRSGYFRAELEQFLLLAREEQVDIATVQGSYAGAMGSAQFMPRSYRAYAVDGDGEDRRDLWGSWDDVIASVANYLEKHGWRAGEPVVATAALWFPVAPGLVPGPLAPDATVKALRDRGLSFETALPDQAPALFIRVDGDGGPELRAGFHNFGVITRYKPSIP